MTRLVLVSTLVLLLAGTPGDANKPTAPPILGCWRIVTSADARYPIGGQLCLHDGAVVAWSERGTVDDAWPVGWASQGAGWRATVPPQYTSGQDVHFDVARASSAELTFRSGAGWIDVRLGGTTALRSDEPVARLRACLACLAASPQATQLDGPAYSLRSCKLASSALGLRCPTR